MSPRRRSASPRARCPLPRAGTEDSVVISQFPSGLNMHSACPSMGSLATLVRSRRRQICTPPATWLPVASHSPSGLTATERQSSSGPSRMRLLGVDAIWMLSMSAMATIRPDRSSSIPQFPRRQGKRTRRTDAEFAPVDVELERPPPDADRPLVIKSPEGSNIRCQAFPIGRKASSVPRARSQSAHARSVPTARIRPSCRIEACYIMMSARRNWANVRYSRAGSAWYVVSLSSSRRTIRPSRLNSDADVAGQVQPRPAQDRVPEPQPPFPTAAGQEHTGGVERRAQAGIDMAFEGRPPDARGRVPEVNLAIIAGVARVVPSGLQATAPTAGAAGSAGRAGPSRLRGSGRWRRLIADGRDLGPVRTEGQVSHPGPAPPPARLTGRQVVHEELAILMAHGDPSAVRAEFGRGLMDRARVLQGDRAPVDVPDRQGRIRDDAWSPGSGRRG